MNLFEKNPGLRPFASDPRRRFYLRPTRIVLTTGDVSDAGFLLGDAPDQISFDASSCTVLKNHGGEHASIVLDIGREIHGSLRLLVQSASDNGVNVNLRFGESVSEAVTPLGEKGSTNDHARRDYPVKLSNWSGTDTNETGYRFVCIELLDEEAELSLKAVEGVLIVRDLDYIGSFECSDPLLNRIYDTAAYTAHLNMQEYMWDGIKRDRLVWIGDMHPEVMTICSVFGDSDVIPKSLDSVRDVTPIGQWMNGIPSYSLWWILCHIEYYRQNGDLAYLREQKEYLSALLPVLCTLIDENGSEIMPDWRFVDWPTNADPEAKHAGLQGLLCYTLGEAAGLCRVLELPALADACEAAAGRMKAHCPPTSAKQAAALLTLSGIADPETIDRDVIAPGGARGYSTFYSYYILTAKAMAGHTAEALDDLRTYYGAMLDLGATTFWEDFSLDWTENAAGIDAPVPEGKKDIHGDFGAYCYLGLRHSLCHGWSSGPVPFLARRVLGVEVLEPGCKKLRIRPDLCGLEWVRGSYPTPYGKVEIFSDGKDIVIHAPDGVEILR